MFAKNTRKVEVCLNCHTPVTGNYCAHCGQDNADHTISMQILVRDFTDQLFGIDSKLIRTVVPLFVRPGFLTNEFNAGKRVRYLTPFRLYIFSSVLFFLLVSRNALRGVHAAPPVKVHIGIGKEQRPLPGSIKEYRDQQSDPNNTHKAPPIERFFVEQSIKANQMGARGFLGRLLDNIPKMMFVLLPVFALLLKLIYRQEKRLYIEHLVFSLHCHAFLFGALAFSLLLPDKFDWVGSLMIVGIGLYFYFAMRAVYKQSWLKTGFKFLIMAICYTLILSFFLLGAALVTFVQV